jgi:peptidoglycan/xylan/chitin deacetylase (PgdA/CDA1 family)
MKKNKVVILLFHRVHPVRDIMWDPMDPKRFKTLIKYFKKRYTVLPLLEILDSGGINSKKPLAAITFDDGYKDFIEYSLPIMDELKTPSSMYIVTEGISKDKPTWTFEIDYLFYNTQKVQINWSLDTAFMPDKFQKNKFSNKKERIAFCLKFKQYIKVIPDEKRKILIRDIFRSFNDVNIPSGLMMTWKDVNQILNAGVEVGSHTVTHPPLATLTSVDLESELQQSRSAYFENTGKFPRIISYPLGSYSPQVIKSSMLAGYDYGLAVNHATHNTHSGNKFEIPRIELYNEPFWKSLIRIEGY